MNWTSSPQRAQDLILSTHSWCWSQWWSLTSPLGVIQKERTVPVPSLPLSLGINVSYRRFLDVNNLFIIYLEIIISLQCPKRLPVPTANHKFAAVCFMLNLRGCRAAQEIYFTLMPQLTYCRHLHAATSKGIFCLQWCQDVDFIICWGGFERKHQNL